jgi:hypothetical protein
MTDLIPGYRVKRVSGGELTLRTDKPQADNEVRVDKIERTESGWRGTGESFFRPIKREIEDADTKEVHLVRKPADNTRRE